MVDSGQLHFKKESTERENKLFGLGEEGAFVFIFVCFNLLGVWSQA